MAWISLLCLILSLRAAELPKLLTKYPPESIRFISNDGRYTYLQKKSGVLSLVTSFRSIDFLTEESGNDYLVKSSLDKGRMIIESISNAHSEMSMLKNHRLSVVDYGNTFPRFVGEGRNAKLHLRDEWITYYDMLEKTIRVQNLVTQKIINIKLSKKSHPFFIPDVEMLSSSTIMYTDINESGHAALVSFDLKSSKSTVSYKSSQNSTRIELCRSESYVGIGEFPFDGVSRGSKIQILPLKDSINLSGVIGVYDSIDQDVGNLLCTKDEIFFIKTTKQDPRLGIKVTEAAKIDLQTKTLKLLSDLKNVNQLIEMDGRVLIPYRGEFYVLVGSAGLDVDTLKSIPSKEELKLEI